MFDAGGEIKMAYSVFTINPGSTSTKIALFHGKEKVFSKNVSHGAEELAQFPDLSAQLSYRMNTIMKILVEEKISLQGIDAFVGRGGGLYSMEGGVYEIDERMVRHAENSPVGVVHPANLGIQIANKFQQAYGGHAYTVNPPSVDEYEAVARVTGMKGVERKSRLHSLNLKEVGIRHAELMGKPYEQCNFIICHIGGGISISAHCQGRMVDGNDIIGGEGPMAPTRCGSLPAEDLIRLCYSGKYTEREMLDKCTKNGGFVDLLGTADTIEVLRRAQNGDQQATLVWDAMVYQINKYIGSMAAVLKGQVDGILLSGGMANSKELTEEIVKVCSFIAPVTVYAGEFEMEAMASGAIRVMSGEEEVKTYTGKPTWPGLMFHNMKGID